ncbi:MAG: DegT/DnrJ/EryC1/StrS family aminotransferase, partial [Bdellovibrionales bacterium]|nr:DegT/DnrJ/EryC1/StrS family aminotransferase [Bdellovibrionales bacterium]
MSIPFIDLRAQYLELKNDIQNRIHSVLEHGQFIMGPEVKESEALLSEYVGCKHTINVSSGTDAAVIAMMAKCIGPGDEVITTAFSFIATAETIRLVGAIPKMVDIDPKTYNINVDLIEKAITPKTRAIMPVSLYGQPANMDEINQLAEKHGLFVIEDAAQSFGGTYKGKKSGNLSHCGVTSFFPAKPLGVYGDGGAIFTNDDALAESCRQILFHGQTARYYHEKVGVNGRMDTLQCAILIPKLEKFPWELEQRQKLANAYSEAFSALEKVGIMTPFIDSNRTSAWAQYTLRVPNRDPFQKKLQELGVPTAIHYPRTMADQPAYSNPEYVIGNIAESRKAAQEVISLPMHP